MGCSVVTRESIKKDTYKENIFVITDFLITDYLVVDAYKIPQFSQFLLKFSVSIRGEHYPNHSPGKSHAQRMILALSNSPVHLRVLTFTAKSCDPPR